MVTMFRQSVSSTFSARAWHAVMAGLERVWLCGAAPSLCLIKSGKTSLDLGAIPKGTVLVRKKNGFAIDSPARSGA